MAAGFTTYLALVIDIETDEVTSAGSHSSKALAIHAALSKMSEIDRPKELLLPSVFDINSNLVTS